MDDSTGPDTGDDPGEKRIESWMDILDDTDWLYDDELTPADRDALVQRFALADVVGGLVASLTHINSQPTLDFEGQYQAGYELFARASAHLEQESRRIESAGDEFLPVADELRSQLGVQRERIAEYFEEHADRHQRFREAMIPVNEQMARENQRAAAERLELQRRTNQDIAKGQSAQHERRVKAFDDWNREWSRTHLR